jgi:DNA-binding XRE family transcriptional regulator
VKFDYRKIEEARRIRGVTSYGLAKGIGKAPQTVAQWENGDARPSIQSIEKLCMYFHVTPNFFFMVKNEDK